MPMDSEIKKGCSEPQEHWVTVGSWGESLGQFLEQRVKIGSGSDDTDQSPSALEVLWGCPGFGWGRVNFLLTGLTNIVSLSAKEKCYTASQLQRQKYLQLYLRRIRWF